MNAALATIRDAQTALFVPGDRPDRFQKAAASGADAVIIDLEDAVSVHAKRVALDATVAALEQDADGVSALVRIDASSGSEQLDRVRTISPDRLLGIVVPKAEDPDALAAVRDAIDGRIPIVALVETARGVAEAESLASVPGIERLALGAIDLALDLDSSSEIIIDYARARLVLASHCAGLPGPLESPSLAVRDLQSVAAQASRARSMGFGGMLCIHPAQVPVVRTAFQPNSEEIEWARRVIEAPLGASSLDGQMIDRPVIDRALRILARVES